MTALRRHELDPAPVTTILITHLHGDHFGGVPFFLLDAVFSKRSSPLTIAGPRGLRDLLHAALAVFYPGTNLADLPFPVTVRELLPREASLFDGIRVTAFPVSHFEGTEPHALRIECSSRVIAFSGDTGWVPSLVDVSREADLFVCEAYHLDRASPMHLDYATLTANRHLLTCKRMVVTHLTADLLSRLPHLELEAPSDGAKISL
jgi:ribonuclease BN (tRNA processing enzyme)